MTCVCVPVAELRFTMRIVLTRVRKYVCVCVCICVCPPTGGWWSWRLGSSRPQTHTSSVAASAWSALSRYTTVTMTPTRGVCPSVGAEPHVCLRTVWWAAGHCAARAYMAGHQVPVVLDSRMAWSHVAEA